MPEAWTEKYERMDDPSERALISFDAPAAFTGATVGGRLVQPGGDSV